MKINNQNYKIKAVRLDSDVLECGKLIGAMLQHRSMIYIRDDLSESRTKQAIAHEVIHALIAESGIGAALSELREGCDVEEIVVTGLENVLFNFLKDNTNFYDKL